MEPVLFLPHRVPFPPNKGDKIRSFHFLRGLAEHYRVRLGTFVDDPEEFEESQRVRDYCDDCLLVPLSSRRAKVRSLSGFFTGDALSIHYFRHRRLVDWVRRQLDAGVRKVVVFSSPMSQYIETRYRERVRVIIDFVDVDSDKWRQYADKRRWPLSWLYRRESRRLLEFDRRSAAWAAASVFVSAREAELFARLAPETAARLVSIENGVDTEYFCPPVEASERPTETRSIVFTGAMDYWANVDAVCWFASEVFPEVRRLHPGASFVIVGARPTEQVRRLERRKGIVVTGRVPDVRPYLESADLVVAPLRIARGIQNKVLEAMAMARPVLASPEALDGLRLSGSARPLVADDVRSWVERVDAALRGECRDLGRFLRDAAIERYSWSGRVEQLVGLLEQRGPGSGEVDGQEVATNGGGTT